MWKGKVKYMDSNFKLIRRTLIILVALTVFTVVMLLLVGKDGLINKEIEEYNDTHVEENSEKNNEKVVVVDNQ